MAEVALRVAQPTGLYNAVALVDLRSFNIARRIDSTSIGKRPSHAHISTVQVHGAGTSGTFVIGDEADANRLVMLTEANRTEKILALTSVGVHSEADIVYTMAKTALTAFPQNLGSEFKGARTFSFGFEARSTDGSTDPIVVS